MPLYNMHGLQLTQAGYEYLLQRRAERNIGPDEGLDIFEQPQEQLAEQLNEPPPASQ